MLAVLSSFVIAIALVLGLGMGAMLTLGGSLTAVTAIGADALRIRLAAAGATLLGLALFLGSMIAALAAVPLA